MTAQQRRNDFLEYFEDWKNRTGHPCLGYYNSTNNEFCGEENLNNEAITRGYVTASFFELDYTRIEDVKKLHKWAYKNTRSIRHGNPSGVLSQYIDYLTEYPSGFSGSGASAGTSLTSRPVGTTKPSSGAITPMSFDYISENGMTLTSAQKELLRKIERTSCALEEFSSIRELRKAKGYRVVVSDKKSFKETVEKELEAYQKYINYLSNKWRSNNPHLSRQESAILQAEIPWSIKHYLNNVLQRLQATEEHVLLGLYRSWDFSYNSPTIYLFKENIDDYAAREDVSPDYVFGFVYIHEAMHAFYNSKNDKGYLSISELEEAFAECGMLDYLTRAGAALPGDLYKAAKNNVSLKQYNGPFEYGFGLALGEISSSKGETSEIISRYREISNWIIRKMDAHMYNAKVRSLKRESEPDSSYDSGANVCYTLVKKILDEDYSAPDYDQTDLPGLEKIMRDTGVSLKPVPHVTGGLPGILSDSRRPARLYTGSRSRSFVQLAVADSVDDVAYAIFKSLEDNPGLLEDVVKILNIRTRPAGDTTVPGEWLSDSINFPDDGAKDIQGGWSLRAGLRLRNISIVSLLRAISLLGGNNNEFSVLVEDGGKYVLFGPARFWRFR